MAFNFIVLQEPPRTYCHTISHAKQSYGVIGLIAYLIQNYKQLQFIYNELSWRKKYHMFGTH